MKKLEIWSEPIVTERVTRLRLRYAGLGVRLEVVDENGNPVPQGCLLHINGRYGVHLYGGVNPELGFPVNDVTGQLKLF